ncbi:HAMP domain-containing protein [bacterium]|nr:HAMP domain-containing protein [bacterium]
MADKNSSIKKSISIQTKLLFYFLILSLIPLLILGFFSLRVSITPLKEYAVTPLRNHTLAISNHIRQELYDVREDVLLTSRLPDLSRMLDYLPNALEPEARKLKEAVYNDFIEFIDKRKKYHYISYCDLSGQEIIRVNYIDSGKWKIVYGENLQNKKHTSFFKQTVELGQGQVYVSDVSLNEEYDVLETPYTKVIYVSTAVQDISRKKRGIITIALKVDTLFKPISEWKIEKYPEANNCIINRKGFYIAHSDRNKEWGTPQQVEMKWSIMQDFSLKVNEQLLNNFDKPLIESDKYVFVTQRVFPEFINPSNYWIIISYLPKYFVYSKIAIFKIILYVLLFFTFVMTVIVALILSSQFTKPIKLLKKGVEIIKDGNLAHRIPLKSNDEIGELAFDFNLMAEELEGLYQNLENKVKQRTEMLQKAMDDLKRKDEQLEKANQLKLDFLTNLSTELRTPLTSIMGYISLLMNKVYGELNDKQINSLQKARKNLYHTFKWLDGIIRISSLSAIQTENITVHKTNFDAVDCVGRALKNLNYVLGGEGKTVDIKFDKKEKYFVFSDKEKFDEIVISVLNAIVYHEVTKGIPVEVNITSDTKADIECVLISFEMRFDKKIKIENFYKALVEPFIHSPTFFNITNLSANVARSLLTWLKGGLLIDYIKKERIIIVTVYIEKGEAADES